ncbi:MAG: hypothetical protein JWL90_322 [Chthoniobacteraceae bacterium]|nr:hypothetical protein [Chthoniobacteraceae bacterium]
MQCNKERIEGVDFARAFFSVCVVIVHLGYVYPSEFFSPEHWQSHRFCTSDFINFHVLLLGVPVFMLVSTYLFARKPYEGLYLRKQVGRLGVLLVFWIIALALFRNGWSAVLGMRNWVQSPLTAVFSALGTIYYFFVSLIAVTIVAHYSKKLSTRTVFACFLASVFAVAVLPRIALATGNMEISAHWCPINFIPYAFAGLLIYRGENMAYAGNWKRWALAAFFISVISALLEWHYCVDARFFEINLYPIPAYSRVSLVFSAVALLLLIVNTKWIKSNAVASFMAKHSLALYCLHPFFLPLFIGKRSLLVGNGIFDLPIMLGAIIFLCYAASLVLPVFLNRPLLR